MQYATINGKTMEYTIKGSSSGDPMILIHGSVFADMYLPLMSQSILTNKYFLVNYHRQGYAGSSHDLSVPVSIQEQAADCKELMKTLNIKRAHVVAHSYAGLLALQLAIDAPDMVHSLSLLEPALMGYIQSGSQFGHELEKTMRLYQEGKKPEALESFLRTVFEGSPQYREIIDRQLPQGAFNLALSDLDCIFKLEAPALQSWNFTAEDAKHIRQPILYVGGENSAHYFREIHELVLSWFPHAQTLMLPNTTHMLHMMNPELVAKGLSNFFSLLPVH